MLSSKISHTAAFVLQHILLPQSSADWFDDDDAGDDDDVDATTVDDDRDWPNEDLDDAETPPLHFGDDKDDDGVVLDDVTETEVAAAAIEIPVEAVVAGSTSTTRKTALPSRTLRTLSASQSPPREKDEEGDDEEDEDGDPIKASQTALPNLRKRVWLAIAANMAFCCSFWVEDSEEDDEDDEMPPLGRSEGDGGGVRYAEEEEIEYGTLCFPESRAESVLPYPDGGGRLALGEGEKKWGRKFEANPEGIWWFCDGWFCCCICCWAAILPQRCMR